MEEFKEPIIDIVIFDKDEIVTTSSDFPGGEGEGRD